ncbi:MAG: hypothetical protein VYD87_19285 [Pseudomonadota bacterium]|nr:hypothetical protein [Pseudomonadota bacterium]MEE3100962.1 hypothetical protein [Pseudomonadota bacterium]
MDAPIDPWKRVLTVAVGFAAFAAARDPLDLDPWPAAWTMGAAAPGARSADLVAAPRDAPEMRVARARTDRWRGGSCAGAAR